MENRHGCYFLKLARDLLLVSVTSPRPWHCCPRSKRPSRCRTERHWSEWSGFRDRTGFQHGWWRSDPSCGLRHHHWSKTRFCQTWTDQCKWSWSWEWVACIGRSPDRTGYPRAWPSCPRSRWQSCCHLGGSWHCWHLPHGPKKICWQSSARKSHSRMVRSTEPVTNTLLSLGLRLRAATSPLWPLNPLIFLPVSMSHSMIAISPDPENI